jgi:uncharacterized LabA/DUF88 family protein
VNIHPAIGGVDLGVERVNLEMITSTLDISKALPNLKLGEGTALLLDVNNLFKRARASGFAIDYANLKYIFEKRCDLRYCAAFSAIDRSDPKANGWESYMKDKGYTVVSKDLKRYTNDKNVQVTKGNMDVELTCAAMRLSEGFAHVIIGTCDGDFVPLIQELKKGHYRKVSVLGITSPDWTGMSDTLVRAADNFYDMTAIKDHIHYRGR